MPASKIILNIHFYLSGILETPRVSYAVANKKFIISENSNPEDEIDWPGIVFTPYEKIIENIMKYVELPEERIKLAEKAYNHFEAKRSNGILSNKERKVNVKNSYFRMSSFLVYHTILLS